MVAWGHSLPGRPFHHALSGWLPYSGVTKYPGSCPLPGHYTAVPI
jgi:hypothetical protein